MIIYCIWLPHASYETQKLQSPLFNHHSRAAIIYRIYVTLKKARNRFPKILLRAGDATASCSRRSYNMIFFKTLFSSFDIYLLLNLSSIYKYIRTEAADHEWRTKIITWQFDRCYLHIGMWAPPPGVSLGLDNIREYNSVKSSREKQLYINHYAKKWHISISYQNYFIYIIQYMVIKL